MITHLEHIITKKQYRSRLDFFSEEYCKDAESGLLIPKYNNIFNSLDWSKEPIESLKTLMSQRAFQLREKYSYIIVYFSGGSDSTTVLNTFVSNNIPIDEIVINAFTDLPDIKYNGTVALDYLKQINYTGKVTLVRLTNDIINTFCKKELWLKHKYFAGSIHTLNRMVVSFYEENNLIKTSNRPSEIGHIYGESNPIIIVKDTKYYCQLPYRMIGGVGWEENLSLFYTSADFPKLHLKQAHIIAKYFIENHPEEKVILESNPKYRIKYKSLIRDPWNQAVDFQKGIEVSGLKNIFDPRSETYELLRFYSEKDISLVKTYKDSIVKDFTSTPLYKKHKDTAALPIKDMVQFYLFDA